MLELKRGASARVQAEMVGFIALRFPSSKKTYHLVISRRSLAGTAKKCANLIINNCEFFERFQSL